MTSAASFFSSTPTSTATTPTAPAPADDQSHSFSDVMDQHSSGSNRPASKPATSSASAADTTNTTTTNSGTTSSTQPTTTRSMTIVAPATIRTSRSPLRDTVSLTTSVLDAATANATGTATTGDKSATPSRGKNSTAASTTTIPTSSTSSTTPASSDMATMMIQAMLHASQLQSTQNMPAVDAITQPPSRVTSTGSQGTATAATATTANSSVLAALTATTTATATSAQASAAIAAANQTNAVKGTETPVSVSAKPSSPTSTKEKKSASDSSEGSFLQASSTAGTTADTTSNLTATAVTAVDNGSQNQQVATQSSPAKNTVDNVSATGATSVGTARDDKRSTMNTDTNLSDLLATTGANSAPEVNILLSSNSDFEDALKQVVHIAQLNDATGSSESTATPTRVAIELQTPPGAIVNVYVSKVDDSYRAQLSTNDPAALSWVQDKIASLRQGNDLGVEVKWLPAQVETSSSISATTTSSDGSSLNWNRDGQQQNNPSSDDRDQYQGQTQSSYEDELVEDGADSFGSTLVTAGGVA